VIPGDEHSDIIGRLTARRPRRARFNPYYTKIIRWARLALPVGAIIIAVIVFTWSGENKIAVVDDGPKTGAPGTASNEVLNPRFESVDGDGRPFTLTARRAVQDTNNQSMVLLERPSGDLKLEGGHWIALEAEHGALEQTTRKLLLRGTVNFFRDGGYQLTTPELHIEAETGRAWSDKTIEAQGPEGTLTAAGMEGRSKEGVLIFKGPAVLTLNDNAIGGNAGGLLR
jgi:lipopolysaccharide export system protein LptC